MLDAKLERESHLKRSSQQPTVRAEEVYHEAKRANPDKNAKAIVLAVRKQVTAAHDEKSRQHLKPLLVQGKFTEVMDLQSDDRFYSQVMYDLPQGQLSWLMRASIDC